MSYSLYKKLKKQNGENFAQTIRTFHDGILEIPDLDVIVQYAGDDARPLLPYLMSLIASNDAPSPPLAADPFTLLKKAGYDAFHADTLEKQNSIAPYYSPGELLCTFNDRSRYQKYHIVHAIRDGADKLRREDFIGREERQDAYGTSVISIQMLKRGGFISIKNRYNHAVSGCDNTFNSNPDNIAPGLSAALRARFNVTFHSAAKSPLPNNYVLIGKRLFSYHLERNNIYYGHQAIACNGAIRPINRDKGNALFETVLFDNRSKTLKIIDNHYEDTFSTLFNREYGGNRELSVDKRGTLTLNGKILIAAERSRIRSLHLPSLTVTDSGSLSHALGTDVLSFSGRRSRLLDMDIGRETFELGYLAYLAALTAERTP